MARAKQVCAEPGCPDLAVAHGRCRKHAREVERFQRRTVPTKIDRARTFRRRQSVVQQWVAKHGWVCPGYKRSPHHSRDLTAQHVQALADGGQSGQQLAVLCRSCNSRHGAEIAAARRRGVGL